MVSRSYRGVSLVELLIAAATLGLLLSLLSVMIKNLSRFARRAETSAVLQRDSRSALEQMVRVIRQGSAASVVVDTPAGQPPLSRLSLTETATGKTVVFRQEGRSLIRQDGAQSQTLTTDLAALAFVYPNTADKRRLKIALSLCRRAGADVSHSVQLFTGDVQIMNP